MINLFSKLFIKNPYDTKNPRVRSAYGVLVSIVGIAVNILLSLGKFIVGAISGSISVTADALNNFSDAGSQIVSFISFKISSKPADRGHPFGHARIEYVASMIVSFLILLVGVELGKESVIKILRPSEPVFNVITVVVLSISILIKLWLGIWGRRVAKKIDSSVIKATSTDSFSDVLATSAVLASTLICRFTGLNIDAYMGLAVSVMILIAGVKILIETKNAILGSAPDPQVVEGILAIAKEYPDVIGVHDMVVHNYGAGNTIASLHAEVDGSLDVYYIHEIIDKMEKQLYTQLGVRATIHMDPTVTDDESYFKLLTVAKTAVSQVNEKITVHDCRYVPGDTKPILIFDITVPYEFKRTDAAIISEVEAKMREYDGKLICEITVDRG